MAGSDQARDCRNRMLNNGRVMSCRVVMPQGATTA
jgi:hypothetical protein